jgi:hypothetical protein
MTTVHRDAQKDANLKVRQIYDDIMAARGTHRINNIWETRK